MKAPFYLFTILLFFLFSIIAIGQNKPSDFTGQIDSLQQLIEAFTNDNEEKVQLLNEYARMCFYGGEIKEGFKGAKEAREISEKLDFEGGKVMYYLTLAAFHGNGDDDMFTYYQKQAQSLSNSLGNRQMNYYVDLETPNVEYGNDFQAMKSKFIVLPEYFKGKEDKEILANILMPLAYFNERLQKPEESIKIYDQIIQLYKELDQVYPVFLFSSYKMNMIKYLGREEEAKQIEFDLIELFAKNEQENAVAPIAYAIASSYAQSGRYLLSVEYYLKSIDLFERIGDYDMVSRSYFDLAIAYENLNLNNEAYESYLSCISNLKRLQDSINLNFVYGALVFPTISTGKYDEARKYMDIALRDTINSNKFFLLGRYSDANGQILLRQDNYSEAIPFFEQALEEFELASENQWTAPYMPLYLTECYYQIGEYRTALQYGLDCLNLEETLNLNNTLVRKKASLWVSKIYEELGELRNAYSYLKMHQEITEESEKLDELNRIADTEVKEILDKSRKELDALEKLRLQTSQQNRIQKLWIFSITGALISVLVILLVLYRNNKIKQKANRLLQRQKEEVQSTLDKLESTQSQLIQSEKMASLGELTAGIAHEIQNPLNFVNNFAEVNVELTKELEEEIAQGDLEEIKTLSKDIRENEEKIMFHGKRAESIVKGMLQHSRSNSGEKLPTDINALADEYLRLAYHGYRAKDKSFNAKFETDFDESLEKMMVVPQDIGRVFLNLISNAFHAVRERSMQMESQGDYEPTVVVKTQKQHNDVLIEIKDNGPGMSDEIKNKIFQPFFTTKPTGEGTGLGLSMSFDIIKLHNGKISVDTTETHPDDPVGQGAGTTFSILLPILTQNIDI